MARINSEHEHATLTVGGLELEVVDVDGYEGVSELYVIQVRARAMRVMPKPKTIVGEPAVLDLYDSFDATRRVTAICSKARTSYHPDGSIWLHAELRPDAWLLTRGRDNRSFQDKSVVDIVTEVFDDVPHRWDITKSYPVYEYIVQYRENDWSFAARLLEREGIYFWFDHDAESTLVMADNSPAAPDLVGGAFIDVRDKSGLTHDREVIEEIGGISTVVPTKFFQKSFNPRNPVLDVSGGVGDGALEIYDAPGGGPTDPAEAKRIAEIKARAAKAASAGVGSTTNCVRAYPGRVIMPGGHALLDGAYFVTTIKYQVRQRRRDQGETDRPWVMQFTAIPKATPYGPPWRTPFARQAGIQSGRVVGPPGEEIYPSDIGEVRVEQHWDRTGSGDDKGGMWMRVAQRGSNDSLQLPRMGWNVLTYNEEGAVDAPSVLTRVNDGDHPPAYKLPDNKTRVVFKTQTTPADGTFNEIYFEDIKGAEEMFINASKDMNVYVQRLKQEGVGNDSTRTVGNDHQLTVLDDFSEHVENDQSVTIGGNDKLDLTATRIETVGNNLSLTIGGNREIKVGVMHGDAVTQNRDLKVGSLMLDMSFGEITNGGDLVTFMIGAAQLKLSGKSIADAHGGVSAQLIGAARLEFTKKDRMLDVEKNLFETIGGADILKTDKNYTDTAETDAVWTAGALMSSETPDLIIRAQDKIQLCCGGSTITILPDSIEFSAPSFDMSKADMIETATGIVEHNS